MSFMPAPSCRPAWWPARARTRAWNSAPLTLEECHALVKEASFAGERVARVHTGDPSLYCALREQAELLDRDGIPWRVIPGVTAACAAAAAAGVTFTVPELTQSLVITRLEGRTPMPERERIRHLAAHQSSLAVYLAGRDVSRLREELLLVLSSATPVLCAHLVGWPEERLVWTDVENLVRCVEKNHLENDTVFLVLPAEGRAGARSRLYAADFRHSFRGM